MEPGAVFQGIKWSGSDADHLLPAVLQYQVNGYFFFHSCRSRSMSCHQNAGQSHDVKALIEHLKRRHEEIKRRLNSGNASYHSVQNLLSFLLLQRSVKINIYETIILPVVLYWCERWSLTLMEEHRLRVFENRVLSRILTMKRDEVTEG
jgi:hypothetical protein